MGKYCTIYFVKIYPICTCMWEKKAIVRKYCTIYFVKIYPICTCMWEKKAIVRKYCTIYFVKIYPICTQASATNLCGGGKSYCEHPTDYPLATILQALKNQSELVQTPGLFDSPVEQDRGRGLTVADDDLGKT